MSAIRIEWPLRSLGWTTAVEVRGLEPALAALALERWPVRGERAESCLDVETHATARDLAGSSIVHATASWTDARRAQLWTDSARATLEFDGTEHAFHGTGLIDPDRPIGGLESLFRATAVLSLARRSVFVIHASAVRRGDEGCLFLGASGAGKTTTARRLGREGFHRIADDMIALDLRQTPPCIHALPFERGSRGARDADLPPACCRGAALVRKGAPAALIASLADRPTHWSAALVRLPSAADQVERSLDGFVALCALPLAVFDVPARGRLLEVVGPWLSQLAQPSGRLVTIG